MKFKEKITDEMLEIWEESHIFFEDRYGKKYPEFAETIAEDIWYNYIDLYDSENVIECPNCCKAILSSQWCVWYCCCPRSPYGWYCPKCHENFLKDENDELVIEVYEEEEPFP